MMTSTRMTRRQFFEKLGKGSLVVGFSLSPVAASILAGEAHAASVDSQLTVLSGILSGPPPQQNDAWLVIDHQGNITLFSGKVEIGTGTQTAFSQIVAEELHVDVSAISYVQGDTSQTPDQGFTAGSNRSRCRARSSDARRLRRSRRCLALQRKAEAPGRTTPSCSPASRLR
jgi:nicotinate dehydrogenase subunit B